MAQRREHAIMQENYFIKRQRDLKESKANEFAKTGHAKRALRESMDPTALEGELKNALNNQSIEHCGDAYDEDGNEVSMFGDSTKGTAEAIARYLKGKGFANVSIDSDDDAAKDADAAWFAVVRSDSGAKDEKSKVNESESEPIENENEQRKQERARLARIIEDLIIPELDKIITISEKIMHVADAQDGETALALTRRLHDARRLASDFRYRTSRNLDYNESKKGPMSLSQNQ